MYDDLDQGSPVDYDDLDLPVPECEEEDASEEPTVAAATAELLAAVTARVHTQHSVGEVELLAEHEPSEPTLATQPVGGPLLASPASQGVHPTQAAPVAPPAPQAGVSSLTGVILASLLMLALIGGAVLLAMVAA